MLFAQFNIPDFEGLAWSVAGPALAGIAFVLFIVVIIVGTLAGTLGASIGWNLTRNTKAGPDETEKSKRRRHPWWARLGISLGAGSVGIGACAFSLHLWLTFIKTGYEMENAESCFLMVAIPGALLGASGAAWLQRRMNVKTNQKMVQGHRQHVARRIIFRSRVAHHCRQRFWHTHPLQLGPSGCCRKQIQGPFTLGVPVRIRPIARAQVAMVGRGTG